MNGDDDDEEIEVEIEDAEIVEEGEAIVVICILLLSIITGITFVGKLHAGFVVQPKPLLPAGE